jgi:hypothetical protein
MIENKPPPPTEANADIRSIGCLLVCMGGIAAAFGLAGLLGFIPHLELEFFGIELNDQRGRIYSVLGSIGFILLGLILVRKKEKDSRC